MKLVHAADLHLDSPLRGLRRYEGAPVEQIRGATRRAAENLVDLCIDEQATLLLIAGDLYDGNWKDYSTGLFFAAQMARLREAGVRVVWLRGNHDAASQIPRYLRLPDNVTELSTQRPVTVSFDDLGIAVHGQGFPQRVVTDDLASAYPAAISGMLNLGLLHSAVTGRPGHEPYAPCSLDTLRNKGYDYWALGHVHTREVLSQEPWVVFPGNLQGRHARETGPKGATVISVEEGRIIDVSHRSLDVVRWVTASLDVSDADHPDDAVELARTRFEELVAEAEGRMLAVKVRLYGRSAAHAALARDPDRWRHEVCAVATDTSADGLWVERVELSTRAPIDVDALIRRGDPMGRALRTLRALRSDEDACRELSESFADLRAKLPLELREGEDGVRLDDPATIGRALAEVEDLLLVELLDGGDEE